MSPCSIIHQWQVIQLLLFFDGTNAFILGLIVVCKGQTTLSWYSYIVALLLGCMMLSAHSLLNIHGYLLSICDTVFVDARCSCGKWYRHQSIDEDGWRRGSPGPSGGQPLCA